MQTKNEFLIGLGGVGGRCISAFRRTRVLHKKDADYLESAGAQFAYLYIDSNDDILNQKTSWQVLGQDIRLEPNEIIQLKQDGGNGSISQIADYPDISPWIGDLKEFYAKRRGVSGDDDESLEDALQGMSGAGQLRRYGRALYALNANKVRLTIQNKITQLINGRDASINFRIFCTLGGGTGSGSVIDVITLIRTLCKENHIAAELRVYPFIAGAAAGASDSGSFYENEYAALRDLNALAIGTFHPYVVGHPTEDSRDNQFMLRDAIQNIYISTELAPGSPSLEMQVEAMAKACFDSIAYTYNFGNPNCLKAISGEDLVAVTPGEPSGAAVRSYRFAALGSKRWCVPSAPIKELLKLDVQKHILEAFLYGSNLPMGISQRDTSKALQDIFNKETSPLIEAYHEIEENTLEELRNFVDSIHQHDKRTDTLLEEMTGIGQKAANKAKALLQDADERKKLVPCYDTGVSVIMDNLLGKAKKAMDWNNLDVWGFKDVKAFLERYSKEISNLATKMVPEQEDTQKEILKNMKQREEEWKKLGFLTIHLTKLDEQMIQWHDQDATKLIQTALLPFKRSIFDELSSQVNRKISALKLKVDEAIGDLEGKISSVEQDISKYEEELKQNTRHEGNDYADIYEYDADHLKKVRQAMASQDKAYKDAMATSYGPSWQQAIKFLNEYSKEKFDSLCADWDTSSYYKTTETVHDEACSQENLKSVLIGSIYERLLQIGGKLETNWDKELGDKVKRFMKNISKSTNLTGMNGLTKPQKSPVAAIAIGLPARHVNASLVDWLKTKLEESKSTDCTVLPGRFDFFEHQSDDEIRVLYMPYWFPARFSPVVDVIYNKYRDTAQNTDKDDIIYFANIDDDGKRLYSKIRPSLTLDGEPNKDNACKVSLAEKLYLPFDDKKLAVIRANELGIAFLKEVEDTGYPNYTDYYASSMREIPTGSFRSDLDRALRMATEGLPRQGLPGMPEEARREILQDYTVKVEELAGSPAAQAEAEKERAFVKKLLKL